MSHSSGRQRASRVFAGREDTLGRLRSAWHSAHGGSGRVVVVEGDAGIGKSAVIEKFLTELDRRGVAVIRLRGMEMDVEPSVPWDMLDRIAAQLAGTDAAAWVAGLNPQALPSLVGEGLAGYLRSGSPVLFLDDAQWADEPSILAMLYAARRLRHDPVLFLVAYQTSTERPFPADDDPASGLPRAWRQALDGEHGFRVPLEGLSGEDILRLATANGYPELSLADARRLYESTGGNPEYLHQLLPVLSFNSILTNEDLLPVPRSLARGIVARLGDCRPQTRALVSAAAVLGPRFTVAALRDVSLIGAPREQIDEARDAGLLDEVPGSGGRELAFPQLVIRAAVYHELSSKDRTELHRRCAGRGGPGALRHRIAAADGRDDVLAADLRHAASEKMSDGDILGACYYLLRALEFAGPEPIRIGLLLTAVESLLVAGKERATDEYVDELRQLTADPWRDYVLGYQRLLAGDLEQALTLLPGSLAALDRGEPSPPGAPADLRARIATQLAILGIVTLSYRDMVEYGTAAVAEESDEPWVRGFAHLAKTVGMALSGDSEQALALLREAGEPGDASASGLEGLAARGMIRLWTDDLDGAARDLHAMVSRATRGEVLRTYQAVGFLGEVEYRRGRLSEAVHFTHLAVGNAEDNDRYWDYPILDALASYPHAARAEWVPARQHAERSGSLAKLMNTAAGLAFAGGAWAAIAQASGDRERLLAAAEQIEANYDSKEPGTHLFGPVLADALAQLGRIDEAAVALERFFDGPGRTGRRSAAMSAARVAARIAIVRGDHDQARRDCRQARDLARALGMPLEVGRVYLLAALGEHRAGRAAAAERALRVAREQFIAIGATAYTGLAERDAAEWGITLSAAWDPLGPLTSRERELVLLVVQGLTNKVIAEMKEIDPRTVETHLSKVFSKFNVKNRAELKSLLEEASQGRTIDF